MVNSFDLPAHCDTNMHTYTYRYHLFYMGIMMINQSLPLPSTLVILILLPERSLSSVVFISKPCCSLVLPSGNNGDQEW